MSQPSFASSAQPSGALYEFGDSYLDVNYYCRSFGPIFPGTGGGCSNGKNLAQQLGTISAYSFSASNDYAVGQSASGPGTFAYPFSPATPDFPGFIFPTYPNMFGQIAYFQSTGQKIGADDLVLLSYVRNDALNYAPLSGAALANATTSYLKTDVSNLISLGARNFVLLGGVTPNDTAYENALAEELPQALSPLASSTVHIRILDLNLLNQRVTNTPAMYGFIAGDCYTIPGCPTAALSVQNQYAFADQHPSDSYSLLIARYIDNLVTSPNGIAAQANIAFDQANDFERALARHFDLQHEISAAGLYVLSGYDWNTRRSAANASGYSYGSELAAIGGDAPIGQHFLVGVAADFSNPNVSLDENSGSINNNSYLFGAYASLIHSDWFVDILAEGGFGKYAVTRPGVIDTLTGSTNGSTYSGTARGGYLFGNPWFQIGPVINLDYTEVRIAGYAEQGDALVAQKIADQNFDELVGSAGFQLRGATRAQSLSWFFEALANHGFVGGKRTVETIAEDSASAIPVFTPVGASAGTSGKVAVGAAGQLTAQLSLSVDVARTFADAGSSASTVSGSFTLRL